DDARQALTRLYTALKNVPPVVVDVDWTHPRAAAFKAAMDDDFNTPEAIAVLFELATEANRSLSAHSAGLLLALGAMLGLLQRGADAFLKGRTECADGLSDASIDLLIQQRLEAKKTRNFAEADRIRDELKASGIVLEDKPGGATEWRRG
ncbi:MAG: DALR domain-containing protein, partial [Rhodocyclaceae bacterium]